MYNVVPIKRSSSNRQYRHDNPSFLTLRMSPSSPQKLPSPHLLTFLALQDSSNPRTLIGHTRAITSLHIIGTGRTILSTSLDGSIRLWDIGSSKETGCVRLTMPISAGIIFSEGNLGGEEVERMRMVVAHTNGTVTFLDLASLAPTTTNPTLISLSTLSPSPLNTIALNQESGFLAVGAQNGFITIFDVGKILKESQSVEEEMQVDNNAELTSQEGEGGGSVILARIIRGPASITSLAFSASSRLAEPSSSNSSLIIGTSDGLPFRLSLSLSSSVSSSLPISTTHIEMEMEKRILEVALLNEFAGGECDSVLLREQAGGGGVVWSGAMDGGLRRYRS